MNTESETEKVKRKREKEMERGRSLKYVIHKVYPQRKWEPKGSHSLNIFYDNTIENADLSIFSQ